MDRKEIMAFACKEADRYGDTGMMRAAFIGGVNTGALWASDRLTEECVKNIMTMLRRGRISAKSTNAEVMEIIARKA